MTVSATAPEVPVVDVNDGPMTTHPAPDQTFNCWLTESNHRSPPTL